MIDRVCDWVEHHYLPAACGLLAIAGLLFVAVVAVSMQAG